MIREHGHDDLERAVRVTDNDATNAAMLAVNTRLGSLPSSELLSWARD